MKELEDAEKKPVVSEPMAFQEYLAAPRIIITFSRSEKYYVHIISYYITLTTMYSSVWVAKRVSVSSSIIMNMFLRITKCNIIFIGHYNIQIRYTDIPYII